MHMCVNVGVLCKVFNSISLWRCLSQLQMTGFMLPEIRKIIS